MHDLRNLVEVSDKYHRFIDYSRYFEDEIYRVFHITFSNFYFNLTISGRHPTTNCRIHLSAGTRENAITIAKFTTEKAL